MDVLNIYMTCVTTIFVRTSVLFAVVLFLINCIKTCMAFFFIMMN